jgi:hypothetical protein
MHASRLARTAGLKGSLVEEEIAAEYLLYRLNWRHFQPDTSTAFEDLRALVLADIGSP